MDLDRVEGTGHEVKGAVKEAAGKVMGDKKTEAQGKVEKTHGTVQRKVGETKDEIRDAVKDLDDAESVSRTDKLP